jgi:hypothetical protein
MLPSANLFVNWPAITHTQKKGWRNMWMQNNLPLVMYVTHLRAEAAQIQGTDHFKIQMTQAGLVKVLFLAAVARIRQKGEKYQRLVNCKV